jgi:hypothetical protein
MTITISRQQPQRRPFSTTIPKHSKVGDGDRLRERKPPPPPIPKFSNYNVRDDEDIYESKEEIAIETEHIFPDTFCTGAEMDVKIIKVEHEYALCRPLDQLKIKGKISKEEMDEFVRVSDATMYVTAQKVYKASIMHLIPPDKVIFSLRRVRRIMRDDFQPFTIVIFDLPYELYEHELVKLMEETGGKVMDVRLNFQYQGDLREPSYVTFLKMADAVAAMRKWNTTKIPVTIDGDATYHYRVRCMKANDQVYRKKVEERLNKELEDRIEKWDWTAEDFRNEQAVNRELMRIIPAYIADMESKEMFDAMGMSETYHQYSVKNDPRWAR